MYYLHGEIGDSTAPPTVLSAFPAEHLSNQQEFGAYFLKFPLLPEWAFLSWRLSPQPLAWLLMLPLPHLIFVIFFFFLPTLLEMKTILCGLLSVLSLNLRLNS